MKLTSDDKIGMVSFLRSDRARAERHARRVANGTAAKPRPKCSCTAYPFPHRPASGLCRYPDPPAEKWSGRPGQHPPTWGRVTGGSSSVRRRMLELYYLHPIRDRERIRRWLPKLYVAYSRRHGYCGAFATMGGWVQAMLVTESGRPADVEPYAGADLWQIILAGTNRRRGVTVSPARRRARAKKLSVPSVEQGIAA